MDSKIINKLQINMDTKIKMEIYCEFSDEINTKTERKKNYILVMISV